MIPEWLANSVLIMSLTSFVGAYIFVSRRERSYVNILTPGLIINLPAFYVLPFVYNNLFGTEASTFAYVFVYATLATESIVFAYVYTRRRTQPIRLPVAYSYDNFDKLAFGCLALAGLFFVPVLLEFREFIFDPRRIYEQTRTGFGVSFYISSILAYLAVVLILFTRQSKVRKAIVIFAAGIVLALHGSKGQVLVLFLLLLIFEVYVKGRRLKLLPALMAGLGIALVAIGSFAATMALGTPLEALETITEYSGYTRNAMLVIDSDLPRQYGRLTWESNVIALMPRALMPNKPNDLGAFYLDAEFYPEAMEENAGLPAFGVGVQYADFGWLAIVYLGLFAALRGWLARVCVARLRVTGHPSDLLLVAFLADITLFPVGIGWLLPETLLLAVLVRFASRIGASHIYHERIRIRPARSRMLRPSDPERSV